MRRREFITLLGGATVWPVVARAQVSAKRPTIAWLSAATAQLSASFLENFLRGMRELGYVEGRNFDMLYRYTDGYQERLPALTEVLAAQDEREHLPMASITKLMTAIVALEHASLDDVATVWSAPPRSANRRSTSLPASA